MANVSPESEAYEASWQVSRRAVRDPNFMAALRKKMTELDAKVSTYGGEAEAHLMNGEEFAEQRPSWSSERRWSKVCR